MISITIIIVPHAGKVYFHSDHNILGYDKSSFFRKIGFIWVGYVIVEDFCQVSALFSSV